MSKFSGEKINLRPFRSEDISGLREWITDEAVNRFMSGSFARPQTWEQTERYLSGLLHGDAGGVNLAIADKGSGRYLGQVSLLAIDHTARKAELAIVLIRQAQGMGLGTDAVRLIVDYAFDHLNLRRIALKVRADNAAAIRCYEKCGFQREGLLREDHYAEGEYKDIVLMARLR